MQVTLNKLSPVLVELEVQVEANRVAEELTRAYQSLAKSAKVRGFRPGKAPVKVLRSLFGGRVAADVAQRLVDETFPQAVTDQKVQTVSQPQIETQKVAENAPFSYKARVEIVPEIAKVDFDKLEAKRPKVDVKPEAIDAELEKLRHSHATLEAPKEPRKAGKGDVLSIDFTVSASGEVVEDAAAEDLQFELGANQVLPAIDEALVGADVGATVDAEVEMPASHQHPKLRGRKVTFHVKLRDLKERVLPTLDDEFAKDVGDYENLAALRAEVEAKLRKEQEERNATAVAEQLVADLVQRNPIPVPPTLVARQVQATEREVLVEARRQGQTATGLSPELKQRIQADSELKVRAGLLMAEIAKTQGIKIGDAEIEEGLKELAEQSGKNVAKLRVEYRDSKKRELLIGMILENKVLDIIEAAANITEE